MFKYKKKEYPSRTLVVRRKGCSFDERLTISTVSLQDAMIKNRPSLGSGIEQRIDEQIYFYVNDDKFNLSAKEICEKHLDEPVKFLLEESDEL